MKSLLILTAGFGEGHNAAARNLREAIACHAPQTNVVVSDVFLDAYGSFNRLVQQGYVAVINRLPHFWQKVFEILDRTRIVEWHIGICGAAAQRLRASLRTQALRHHLQPIQVATTCLISSTAEG